MTTHNDGGNDDSPVLLRIGRLLLAPLLDVQSRGVVPRRNLKQRSYNPLNQLHDAHCANGKTVSYHTPFPQIDIIGAMVIVWRVRGKIIRSVLCNIVCNNCAQCDAHSYEQT